MILTDEDILNILDVKDKVSAQTQRLFIEDARSIESTILSKLEDKLKDAERYHWLRAQHWSDNTMCIIENPKVNVKLGAQTYSGSLLDKAIDESMGVSNVQD